MSDLKSPTGTSICVTDRTDLERKENQDFLRAARDRDEVLLCGCGGTPANPKPKVVVYLSRSGIYTVKRHSAAEHAKGCPLFRPISARTRENDPRSSILLPPKSYGGGLQEGDETQGSNSTVTFRQFISRVICTANVKCWIQRFDVPHLRNPFASELITAFSDAFHNIPFFDSSSAVESADRHDLEILHGLLINAPSCFDDFEADEPLPLLLQSARTKSRNATLVRRLVSVAGQIFADALQACNIYDHTIIGPYYFFATVDASGKICRLALLPVYFDGLQLHFVDSGIERYKASRLIAEGVCFLKPTWVRELLLLAEAVPQLEWLRQPWPSEPDYIGMSPSSKFIIELAGLEDENYIKNVFNKLRIYRSWGTDAVVLGIRGQSYPRHFQAPIVRHPQAVKLDHSFSFKWR